MDNKQIQLHVHSGVLCKIMKNVKMIINVSQNIVKNNTKYVKLDYQSILNVIEKICVIIINV